MFAVWVGGVAGEGGKGMSLNAATAMKLRAIAIVVSYGGNQDKGQEKEGQAGVQETSSSTSCCSCLLAGR